MTQVGAARGHDGACAGAAPARPVSRASGCCAFFDAALVVPVLTAHPTEVRRKSTIDREMEVAGCSTERDRLQLTPESWRPTRRRCAAPS